MPRSVRFKTEDSDWPQCFVRRLAGIMKGPWASKLLPCFRKRMNFSHNAILPQTRVHSAQALSPWSEITLTSVQGACGPPLHECSRVTW